MVVVDVKRLLSGMNEGTGGTLNSVPDPHTYSSSPYDMHHILVIAKTDQKLRLRRFLRVEGGSSEVALRHVSERRTPRFFLFFFLLPNQG